MRPISLTVEGLRSFRKETRIDFTDRNQLAIIGDTGAGKSSILDAITYALYRQTTFSKQPNQELMNASAMQMRVVLTFAVASETWRVTRALKRTKGGFESVPPTLQRLDVVESLAGTADVAARIQRLVGLDGDAFLRTVILPQGNFARLLIADKPTDRSTVLRQVWQTDELEAVGEVAGQRATEAKALRVGLQMAALQYPQDPKSHLATLRKNRTARRKEAAKTERDLDEVGAAATDQQAADNEKALCQGVLRDIGDTAVRPLMTWLDQIRQVDKQIAGEDGKLSKKIAAIEQQLAEMAADEGQSSLAEIIETMAKLRSVGLYIELTGEAVRASHDLSAKTKEAKARVDKAQQEKEGCKQKAERHRGDKDKLDKALETASVRRAEVEKQYTACEAARASLASARQGLASLQREAKAKIALRTKLDEEVRLRRQEKNHLDAVLEVAMRKDLAASAARGLHAGEECPVCAQTLPTDWQAPVNAPIADAEVAATAADGELAAAQKEAASAEGILTNIGSQTDDAEQVVRAREAEFCDALQGIQKLVPDLTGEMPAKEQVLGPLDVELAHAKEEVEDHGLKQKALDAALARAMARNAAAEEGRTSLDLQEKEAHGRFVDSTNDLKRELTKLPKPFQPSIDVPDDWRSVTAIDSTALASKTEAAKVRHAELSKKDEERNALQGERKALEAKREQLAVRRDDEVAAPLSQLCQRANKHIEVLTLAVGRLDLQQSLPAALAGGDVAKLHSGLADIQATRDAVRREATEGFRQAMEKQATANVTLAKFAERFDIAKDDWQAVADAAAEANADVQLRKLQAESSFDGFSAIVDDVLKLHALLAKTTARERALTDLAKALNPGGFLKWLTLRRSRSLLSHASVMLKQMSGDRYAFAEPDEADAPWQVLDNDSGQARSPASLSGGEQFIASLALALGMVEMMARSGGRLESLFLDEGFGSLDRNNLDAAVEALAMVASGGRMVGVISHVRAVAEQFENVLAVTRAEGGSQARWLTDSQRREMAEDALTGLLD